MFNSKLLVYQRVNIRACSVPFRDFRLLRRHRTVPRLQSSYFRGAALFQGSILQFQGFQKLQVSSGFRCAERDCRVLRLLRFWNWFQMNNQRESLKQQAPVTCQFTSIFQKFVLVNQFLGLKCLKKHPSSIRIYRKSMEIIMFFNTFPIFFPGRFP